MNSRIFEYVSFLLISNNCVIIPGLGGFIRNNEISTYNKEDSLLAPYETVIFNPDLRHDDGLLTSLCQSKDTLSYDLASKKVKNAVDKIKIKLHNNENISCSNLGHLSLTKYKTVVFKPNYNYTHPDTWGLSDLELNPLNRISSDNRVVNNQLMKKNKRISNYIAAAIALILFFLIPPIDTTINHNGQSIQNQQANILLSLKNSLLPIIEPSVNSGNKTSVETSNADTSSKLAPERIYYIIIGSETSEIRVNTLLDKFKKDFSNVSIIKSDGRYRLYIEAFEDKKEAESYLKTFRLENSKYRSAWILSFKNKR